MQVMGKRYPGLVRRGDVWYFRKRVPENIRNVIGKTEIIQSLETSDVKIAKELYYAVFAEVGAQFSNAERSLKPLNPKPLTKLMARQFAAAWYIPQIKDAVEEAFESLGVCDKQGRLIELNEDEAHLISGRDEEALPGLQKTADKILFENGYPVLEHSGAEKKRRRKQGQPNVDCPSSYKMEQATV